jgi:plastocyanin
MTTPNEPPNADRTRADDGASSPSSEARKDRVWQEWMMVGVGLTGLLAILAVIVSVVALASKNPTTATAAQAAPSPQPAGAPASQPAIPAARTEAVKLAFKSGTEHGKRGPDGKWHDAYLPANFTVHAGDKVTVTVYNYDDMPHSFTSATLNSSQMINQRIPAGAENAPSETTFTFTAPAKTGRYLSVDSPKSAAPTHVGSRGPVTRRKAEVPSS